MLIYNTKIKVNMNGTISLEFESILGAFQGDCMSGDLFTIILAALHHQEQSSLMHPSHLIE